MKRFGIMNLSIANRDISPIAKVVYTVLNMHRNPKTQQCNPSYRLLAQETRLSIGSISKAIQILKDANLIQQDVSGRKVDSAKYVLLDVEAEHRKPELEQNKQGVQMDEQGVQGCEQGVHEYEHGHYLYNKNKNKNKNKNNNTKNRKKRMDKHKVIPLKTIPNQHFADTALELVQEWNELFPKTAFGANQLMDQSALAEMLGPEINKTPDEIRAIMKYLADTNSLKYWKRPKRLMDHTNAGLYVWAHIEINMEEYNAKKDKKSQRAIPIKAKKPKTTLQERISAYDKFLKRSA